MRFARSNGPVCSSRPDPVVRSRGRTPTRRTAGNLTISHVGYRTIGYVPLYAGIHVTAQVIGRCHGHVDWYSAATCQRP